MSSTTPYSGSSTQRRNGRLIKSETIVAWLFLLPSLIGFTTFFAAPAIRGLLISFTDWNLLTEPTNVGLANYERLLQDPEFRNALRVTLQYVLWNIPLQTVLAVIIAFMMDRLTKSTIIRGILLLPWLMPNVIVALLFLWLLDPSLGVVNAFIEFLGFEGLGFFGNLRQAMPTVAGVNVWRHVGYTALLIFAGLQTIPESLYEAAAIDGANEFQIFIRITVPLLRPVLAFVLVTSIIGSFQIFDTIAVTTEGGPINATEVINWLIFERAFERFDMGYATTVSMALFVILIIVSLIQLRILRADESDY
ncbi:MAG: sugar ABC transporter permease [Chloroflexota bacterium]